MTLTINKKDIIAALIGLFSATQVRVIGLISISELFIIASVLFILYTNNWYFYDTKFRRLLFFAILWLFGAILSDLYNQSPIINMAKGIFTIIIFMCCLVFAYWLLMDDWERRLGFWLAGAALSTLIQMYIFPSLALSTILENGGTLKNYFDAWRMAIVGPFILLAIYFLYHKWRWLAMSIILGNAIYGVYNYSRGTLLIGFIVFAILFIIGNTNQDNIYEKITNFKKKGIIIILVIIASGYAAFSFYAYGSEKGFFGERAQQKYYIQRYGNKIGIASGRDQSLIALIAIKDSPIFGFGSYAEDKGRYREKFYKQIESKQLKYLNEEDFKRMPSHSYILQAWVENGIFGLLFWLNIVFLITSFVRSVLLFCYSQIGYLLIMVFNLTWAIFFSPFGDRLGASISIVTILIIMYNESLVSD